MDWFSFLDLDLKRDLYTNRPVYMQTIFQKFGKMFEACRVIILTFKQISYLNSKNVKLSFNWMDRAVRILQTAYHHNITLLRDNYGIWRQK